LNQEVAARKLLRFCQNALPCSVLVPEGVMNITCEAPAPVAGLEFEVANVISATWSSNSRLGEKSTALVRM